jgi:hypothetical protein
MKLIYGIVLKNTFYSNNAKYRLSNVDDGIYAIDIMADNIVDSIVPADMNEFEKYVKTSAKMNFIYGISFKDGFVPLNIIKWKNHNLPIKLSNTVSDDWEIIKILHIYHENIFFYIENSMNNLSMKLLELKEIFDENKSLNDIKGVTPEMRFIFSLHLFAKAQEEIEFQKLKEEEYRQTAEGRIKTIIERSQGQLISFKEHINRGYEINWTAKGETINTLVNYQFAVIEAGFCVSGYDKTQSLSSVVNLLKDYKEEGSHINKTRDRRG